MRLTKAEILLLQVIATCIISILTILTQYYPGNPFLLLGIAIGAAYGIHAIPAVGQLVPRPASTAYHVSENSSTLRPLTEQEHTMSPDEQNSTQAPELANPVGAGGPSLMGIAPPVTTGTEPVNETPAGQADSTGQPQAITREEFDNLTARVKELEDRHM
ncbi:MAG TPA: hypothetical protein VIY48_11020 [Candidatus Paceibacterota bacterium]